MVVEKEGRSENILILSEVELVCVDFTNPGWPWPSMAATYMQSIHSSFINNVKPDLLEKLQRLSYGLGADKRAHTVEAERRQLFL